ncbi:MAG: hypothetical protein NTU70_07245 [Methylococcales bacterium]|nr:hypothetical protein [Methylococcales bacterium]
MSIHIQFLIRSMHISSNLPRFIAIPLILVIVVASVVMFSVAFAILLIPMAIMGFRFWKMIRLAQKQQNGDVIDAQYTVIEKRDDDL